MEIVKELVIKPMTTDGKQMETGKKYVFIAQGKTIVGIFAGYAKKGALIFKNEICGAKVSFNVLPKSISTIYEATLEVKGGNE